MTSNCNLTFFGMVFILPMVTFYCNKKPTIGLKKSNDLYYFIRFHYYELLMIQKY